MTDQEIATLLLEARDSGAPIQHTPPVADAAQAYRVQRLVMAELGEIGGWKVGSPSANGPISCAPMPTSGVFDRPVIFDSAAFTQREVESEICFRIGADLRPRNQPYSFEDVWGAVTGVHPGIEVLQSRFADPDTAGPVALLADFIQTGAFVIGAPIADCTVIAYPFPPVLVPPKWVKQTIAPGETKSSTANPAGDMVRLIQWLADVGAVWAGGLRAGQIVTCGSWTGKTRAAPGSTVTTRFDGAEPLSVSFTAL